jgi:hypothetical protein
MSALEQVPGQLSNEGYPFINGVPVPMPDINSIHAIEARRVEAKTGGSYLEYIAGRLASQIALVESAGPPQPVEPPEHSSQMIGCYRGYLRSVLNDDPRLDELSPVEVQRWFNDYNARIQDQ